MTRTPAKRYFVAEIKDERNWSRCETFINTSRATAFRAFVGMLDKGERIHAVREIDEANMDEMERFGFRPETTRPARVNWSNLDLY